MNKYKCLHETPIRTAIELLDLVKNTDPEDILDRTKRSKFASTSIARIASNMTLVFPVMCSNTLHIDTDMMIMKAIERKCVQMLQILFSAYQVSNVEDAEEFINQFHSNIRINGKATIDDFIALGDKLSESTSLTIDRTSLSQLTKDFRENCYFVLENDISPLSISDRYHGISESAAYAIPSDPDDFANFSQKERHHSQDVAIKLGNMRQNQQQYDDSYEQKERFHRDDLNEKRAQRRETLDQNERHHRETLAQRDLHHQQEREDRAVERNEERYFKTTKDNKDTLEYFKNQILDSDVKKANELVATNMVVNFTMVSPKTGKPIPVENIVIGIKARMIPVSSDDIINHLLTKLNDKNFILQLIRATTREISFFKDFVLAIDNAKIEALARSKRGSANPMWKVLETRAKKSRLNRFVGVKGNNANAITTLVISQEEVDYVRKNFGKDFDSVKIINTMLDAYNLMAFVIVDEALEVAKFKFDDGENMFETLTFSNLEREASDNSYKKIVNLMSKLS